MQSLDLHTHSYGLTKDKREDELYSSEYMWLLACGLLNMTLW